jgi:hypothetical protein
MHCNLSIHQRVCGTVGALLDSVFSSPAPARGARPPPARGPAPGQGQGQGPLIDPAAARRQMEDQNAMRNLVEPTEENIVTLMVCFDL